MPFHSKVFIAEWDGDRDAGIRWGSRNVTITLEEEWTPEDVDFWRESVANAYDGRAYTVEEFEEKHKKMEEWLAKMRAEESV
jgi:hypothetical protein